MSERSACVAEGYATLLLRHTVESGFGCARCRSSFVTIQTTPNARMTKNTASGVRTCTDKKLANPIVADDTSSSAHPRIALVRPAMCGNRELPLAINVGYIAPAQKPITSTGVAS